MLDEVTVYSGFDAREEYGFHTFVSSLITHSSIPVSVTPIGNALLKSVTDGRQQDESTDFARIRFLVPWLRGFRGWALFADGSDMVVRADIAELWALRSHNCAVQVVKHEYTTQHEVKFKGTLMEAPNRDYPRKNWSSVMLINCAHFAWRQMTPDVVRKMAGLDLQAFRFMRDELIGALPAEWNWLAQEFGDNPDAKLIHYTAGIPAFPAYSECVMSDAWAQAALRVVHVSQ